MIAQHLMQTRRRDDRQAGRHHRELDSSTDSLAKHGEALDRAAESARNDIAVLLDDLPKARSDGRTMSEQLQAAGTRSLAAALRASPSRFQLLAARAQRTADDKSQARSRALTEHLAQVETRGDAAAAAIGEANDRLATTADDLMQRAAITLEQIRAGIDAQAAAVASLVEQSSAGIGRAGVEAAESLGSQCRRTRMAHSTG